MSNLKQKLLLYFSSEKATADKKEDVGREPTTVAHEKNSAGESNAVWAEAFSMVQHVKPLTYIIMIILFLFVSYVSKADFPLFEKVVSLVLPLFIMLTLTVSEYTRIQEEEWKRKHGK